MKNKIKKIIPAVIGLSAGILLAGCSNNLNGPKNETIKYNDFMNSIDEFENSIMSTSANTERILNNYKLEIAPIENTQNPTNDSNTQNENDKQISDTPEKQTNENYTDEFTLYNLSTDIKENCERYIQLKQEITEAINETETLLNKVKNKEIELNSEQRMMLHEQSKQLKNLGRDFTRITAQLSHSVDDLHKDDINSPLKYLVVLNNLIDGNEMAENGLRTIELINQTFNANRLNKLEGKITYRYKKEGEPEIYKEFNLIDGQLKEIKAENADKSDASSSENNSSKNETEIMPIDNTKTETNKILDNTKTILQTENNDEITEKTKDSENLQNSTENKTKDENSTSDNKNVENGTPNLNRNIDTFYPNYSNIDTFYNTARNGYMNNFGYGYGGYGFNGYNGMYGNPMAAPLNNYGVDSAYNTPNVAQQTQQTDEVNNNDTNKENTKKSKKRGLKKNVDSYKKANSSSPSAKIRAIKDKVKKIFG